jgi:hypothetical protein
MLPTQKRARQFNPYILLMAALLAAGCGVMPSTTDEDIARALGVRFNGTVSNAVTGAPLSRATVMTQGVTKVTFANGVFLFLGDGQAGDGLRAGLFPVFVRHDGFVDVQRDVTLRSNADNVADFRLQPIP